MNNFKMINTTDGGMLINISLIKYVRKLDGGDAAVLYFVDKSYKTTVDDFDTIVKMLTE